MISAAMVLKNVTKIWPCDLIAVEEDAFLAASFAGKIVPILASWPENLAAMDLA